MSSIYRKTLCAIGAVAVAYLLINL